VQWLQFCETPTKKTILLSSVLEICYHTWSLAEPSLRTEPYFLVTGTLLMWWWGPCPLVTLLGRSETDYVQWKHSCSGRALPEHIPSGILCIVGCRTEEGAAGLGLGRPSFNDLWKARHQRAKQEVGSLLIVHRGHRKLGTANRTHKGLTD
jgi:hypothetical protein